jgi:RNAse (barnase) inhibitor barstar
MPTLKYIVDGSRFNTLEEAASEFTRALDFPKPWTGNLDVLDDFLTTRTGSEEKSVVVWRNSEHSRKALNHEQTARWYEQRLGTCHTSNLASFEQRLAEAQEGRGPTVFDWLVDIFRERKIELKLE